MTNSTVEDKKLEIFIYEMMEFRFGYGTGTNYSINTSVKEVADYVKQHYTPNSKLQESNEKYLEGFWEWLKEELEFGGITHKTIEEYNKLNGGKL